MLWSVKIDVDRKFWKRLCAGRNRPGKGLVTGDGRLSKLTFSKVLLAAFRKKKQGGWERAR